jgi:hypothetical protein
VPHRIVDAEGFVRMAALYRIVPKFVDPFPTDRQQRRILFHDRFGAADQILSFLGVDLPVDLGRQGLKFWLFQSE